MTLLLTLLAALAATAAYAFSPAARRMRVSLLCEIYWGAGIMWIVDMAIAYAEEGAAYAQSVVEEAGSEALLGLAVIVLGLAIWAVALMIRRDAVPAAEN